MAPRPATSIGALRKSMRWQTTHQTHFNGHQYVSVANVRPPIIMPPNNPAPYQYISEIRAQGGRTTSEDAFQAPPSMLRPPVPIRPSSAAQAIMTSEPTSAKVELGSTYSSTFLGFPSPMPKPFIPPVNPAPYEFKGAQMLFRSTSADAFQAAPVYRMRKPFVPPTNPAPYQYAGAKSLLRTTSAELFQKPPVGISFSRRPFIPPVNPAPFTSVGNDETPMSSSHAQFQFFPSASSTSLRSAGMSKVDPNATAGAAMFGNEDYM
mmetsp:Transcript_19001/g.48624  ORF Transcript_19001/g.48624 Transcript_19001/m.48624 type:complete len:264 (+) Transcript_19001:2-793(+)